MTDQEQAIYDNREAILDNLEVIANSIICMKIQVRGFAQLGMTTSHLDLLDAVTRIQDQFMRLGDELSDIVTKVENA